MPSLYCNVVLPAFIISTTVLTPFTVGVVVAIGVADFPGIHNLKGYNNTVLMFRLFARGVIGVAFFIFIDEPLKCKLRSWSPLENGVNYAKSV